MAISLVSARGTAHQFCGLGEMRIIGYTTLAAGNRSPIASKPDAA
jgi:hypothetical protein